MTRVGPGETWPTVSRSAGSVQAANTRPSGVRASPSRPCRFRVATATRATTPPAGCPAALTRRITPVTRSPHRKPPPGSGAIAAITNCAAGGLVEPADDAEPLPQAGRQAASAIPHADAVSVAARMAISPAYRRAAARAQATAPATSTAAARSCHGPASDSL